MHLQINHPEGTEVRITHGDYDTLTLDFLGAPAPGRAVNAQPIEGHGFFIKRLAGQPIVSVAGTPFDSVLDTRTGLEWAAQTRSARTWAEADAAAKSLTIGGHSDWRMPTVKELLSLVDYTRSEPAIDVEAFPNTGSYWYWTSTPAAWSSDLVWVVDFGNGGVYYHLRSLGSEMARAVRSAAPAGQ